ncbi:MAG: glycosyltransferase [Bdellovibrionaceae bacterium]|nr:glycosyltransferase [Pseudobdellovibrionaceae bacterium]
MVFFISLFKKFFNSVLGVIYHHLPVSQELKNKTKKKLFETIPFLFKSTRAFKSWEKNNKITMTVDELPLYLPSKTTRADRVSAEKIQVDIIIPIYRGLQQTKNCIESVLNSHFKTLYRLILINDCSPEIELTNYLRELTVKHSEILLLENSTNLGFTATVNKGMSLSDSNDVVLLNSDTQVAGEWLDKLKTHCYSQKRIGTVTPFSNNATICSFPDFSGCKQIPFNLSVSSIDQYFTQANYGRSVTIPSGVGFCLYIQRGCLDDVGLFDVETFGKGYGEENDFCQRAYLKKWRNLLACDTFVFHEGEVSFQETSNPRKQKALEIIAKRYPEYQNEVKDFSIQDPAAPFRIAAILNILKNDRRPKIISILHSLGGGTEQHVSNLVQNLKSQALSLLISTEITDYGVQVSRVKFIDEVLGFDLKFPTTDIDFITSLLSSISPSGIHIHHQLGLQFNAKQLIQKLNLPFVMTTHDYFYICPYFTLTQGDNYCEEPNPSSCNQCIAKSYPHGAKDISLWRDSYSWFFQNAQTIFCPSVDTLARYQKYFPKANFTMVYHDNSLTNLNINSPEVKINTPSTKEDYFRIAILGSLIQHKGLNILKDLLTILKHKKSPLHFHLIGDIHGPWKSFSSKIFTTSGKYKNQELPQLIKSYDPHLILFLSRCPETYSFTLSSALAEGRPIAAPELGAFPERLQGRSWTWLFPANISAEDLLNFIEKIYHDNFLTRKLPQLPSYTSSIQEIKIHHFDFYFENYLSYFRNKNEK